VCCDEVYVRIISVLGLHTLAFVFFFINAAMEHQFLGGQCPARMGARK
jgi:hypothetical protein